MVEMSLKERMLEAVQHQPVDQLPTQINYTAGMGRLMEEHLGVSSDELPLFLGNHMIRVDINDRSRFSEDGRLKFDFWGVGFDTEEEGYFASVNPLAEHPDLDSFAWPDVDDLDLLTDAATKIEKFGETHFITPNFGFVLFERAWALRGFEKFFMDMSLDPDYTNELLDRITELQLRLIHRFLDLGVDAGYFGDDYGAQKGLLFSPKMWREFIKPRLARLFEPFKEREMPILMHSDGQIQQILPDLVEIGLTTLNPVQPEVLDHERLYQEFGGKLAFYGGISTQTVLPNGTPDDVKTAARLCIQQLAPRRTGLVLAPSHRLMSDIPIENVVAMLEVFQDL